MNQIVLFIALLFSSSYLNANALAPLLARATPGLFLQFDIWWMLATLLVEVGIFWIVVRNKSSLFKIILAVCFANIVSAGIGYVFVLFPIIDLYIGDIVLTLDMYLLNFGNFGHILLTGLALLLGISLNTLLELPVYVLFFSSIERIKVLWATFLSNVVGNAVMFFLLITTQYVTQDQNYSIMSLLKRTHKQEEEIKTELPKGRASRRKSRATSTNP